MKRLHGLLLLAALASGAAAQAQSQGLYQTAWGQAQRPHGGQPALVQQSAEALLAQNNALLAQYAVEHPPPSRVALKPLQHRVQLVQRRNGDRQPQEGQQIVWTGDAPQVSQLSAAPEGFTWAPPPQWQPPVAAEGLEQQRAAARFMAASPQDPGQYQQREIMQQRVPQQQQQQQQPWPQQEQQPAQVQWYQPDQTAQQQRQRPQQQQQQQFLAQEAEQEEHIVAVWDVRDIG